VFTKSGKNRRNFYITTTNQKTELTRYTTTTVAKRSKCVVFPTDLPLPMHALESGDIQCVSEKPDRHD